MTSEKNGTAKTLVFGFDFEFEHNERQTINDKRTRDQMFTCLCKWIYLNWTMFGGDIKPCIFTLFFREKKKYHRASHDLIEWWRKRTCWTLFVYVQCASRHGCFIFNKTGDKIVNSIFIMQPQKNVQWPNDKWMKQKH